MAYNPKYGPCAQTPQQRAYVLQQMLAACAPRWRRQASAYLGQLYDWYVAGELSWNEVRALRDNAVS
ncbi:hypothetical protein EJV47_24075 [Hymenobacter gummosus]|uniref:Antitoxin VbhA domain-containing protein n=1 Tax=Hymenobacter gummosus TaxID=1776032 RepID=A0A3S0K1S3_9BACT|nr:hypothetical protein [Hymenobacter gummosus]RTQ45910.1 hypothetical protein EJV47_24075 [Hymenobacter gummosus]